ncbi:MAG: hypothetical protein IJH03_03125, partial [Clostridia bacterium]|nr:hypothetical protein [Clostridia bacterium]
AILCAISLASLTGIDLLGNKTPPQTPICRALFQKHTADDRRLTVLHAAQCAPFMISRPNDITVSYSENHSTSQIIPRFSE